MKPCGFSDFVQGDIVFSQRTRKYYRVHENCGEGGLYVRRLIGGPNGAEYGSRMIIKSDYCVLWYSVHECHVHSSL